MGNTELAIQDLSLGKSVDKRMEEIVNASSRASELIHNLLAFSRKQTVQPRILDINRVLKNMHSMLVRLIGEHVVMKILSKPNIGSIKADPVQLEQIVLNLVINARDAMPNGGELIIETADVRRDFSLPGKQVPGSVGDYVMLSVSDTGCGMSARVREKIFEPFFSTKPEGKGTGLGLATVYGIVEQNDGHIEVHSEQGEGTSLKVYFPRESRVIEKQRSEPRSESAGGDETVLLVEDEKSVYEMTMLLLQNLGYKVLSARSGEEALQIAERYKGTIDLLLTDVVMPRMNGRELAQRLAETRTDVKVLYTSGYAQNVIADHGILHDGVHFLAKPYTLTALAAHIRNVLESDHK
jgi:CheY-like chemotaxis protein